VFPWDEPARKLHARLMVLKAERAALEDDEDTTDELLAKHDNKFTKPLKDINALLRRGYTFDTLPEHAGETTSMCSGVGPLHLRHEVRIKAQLQDRSSLGFARQRRISHLI
jgi:hypothetical protein